jgi:galactokinase
VSPAPANSAAAQADIARAFRERFGSDPILFRAPGRVNLIGEHTDYNDGFVMPAAIEFACRAAAAPRNDRRIAVYSANFHEVFEFSLDDPRPAAAKRWSDYVHGVAVMLARAGHRLRGANLLVTGNVPLGAGLSSSAAIEVVTAFALLGVSNISVERTEIARICQRAENEFVGARCGIMDQFIACHGRAGHALMLDCRSLGFRLLPLPLGVRMVIANTMVKHQIAAGEYNRRRAECEEGVRLLAETRTEIHALRDVSLDELERQRGRLPEVIYRRCRHVVSENARVERAAAAMERGDMRALGALMADSHRSLRDDYEVSAPELDLMVELAVQQPGVTGSRMTGGGFGGCTISLVESSAVQNSCRELAAAYLRATGNQPEIYVSGAAEGAGQIE